MDHSSRNGVSWDPYSISSLEEAGEYHIPQTRIQLPIMRYIEWCKQKKSMTWLVENKRGEFGTGEQKTCQSQPAKFERGTACEYFLKSRSQYTPKREAEMLGVGYK